MFFCLHQFLEEIDETTIHHGGNKNLRVTNIHLFGILPKNLCQLIVILKYLAKAIEYSLFHPETKNKKIQ